MCSVVDVKYRCNSKDSIPRLSYMTFNWYETYVEGKGPEHAAKYLTNELARFAANPSGRMNPNLPTSRLRKVKYLLIPVQAEKNTRVALIAVSPMNKTVELLDSMPILESKIESYFHRYIQDTCRNIQRRFQARRMASTIREGFSAE